MGHSLPQALTAWGEFVIDIRTATHFFLKELYSFQVPSQEPLSDKPKKPYRNTEVRRRYAEGESVPDLAKAFGISKARIYQILKGRRK